MTVYCNACQSPSSDVLLSSLLFQFEEKTNAIFLGNKLTQRMSEEKEILKGRYLSLENLQLNQHK